MRDIQVARHAIPRPPRSSYTSLCEAMGFQKDSPEFNAFTAGVRRLSSKYLNTGLSCVLQDRTKWEKLFEEVCRTFPFVTQYEEAWPVEAYVRSRLGMRKHRQHISGVRSSAGRQHHVAAQRDDGIHDVPQPIQRHAGDQLLKHNDTHITAEDCPVSHRQDCVTAPDPSPSTSRKESPTTNCPHGTAPSVALRRSHDSQGMLASSQDVAAFLKAVNPSLEHLKSRFVQAGIVDIYCVHALAQMPDGEKNVLLRESLELSSFQVHAVRVALAKSIAEV